MPRRSKGGAKAQETTDETSPRSNSLNASAVSPAMGSALSALSSTNTYAAIAGREKGRVVGMSPETKAILKNPNLDAALKKFESTLKINCPADTGTVVHESMPVLSSKQDEEAATKSAKNKRKKENAKLKKAKAAQQEAEEKEILEKAKEAAIELEISMALSGEGQTNRNVYTDLPKGVGIEVKSSPGKGLGVFATRDVIPGGEIFREDPLLKGNPGCHFVQLEALLRSLPEEKQKKFATLSSGCRCKSKECKETYLMKVWGSNAFDHFGKESVQHLYYVASRLNHSCEPNAFQAFTPDGTVVLKAMQSIKQGEEICFDYGCHYGTSKARRSVLMKNFSFRCQCKACKANKIISAQEILFRHAVLRQAKDDPTALVIGRQTPEEIKIAKEIQEWYHGFHEVLTGRTGIRATFHEMLDEDLASGESSIPSRHLIRESALTVIARWFQANNKYNVGQEPIDRMIATEKRRLTHAMAASILNLRAKLEAKLEAREEEEA